MNWYKVTRFVLLAGLGGYLLGCGSGQSTYYKYRITVAVRDHGELLTASNVVAVRETYNEKCLFGPFQFKCGGSTALCGEAAAVKMHNGLYLFVHTRGPLRLNPDKVDQWRSSPTLMLLR